MEALYLSSPSTTHDPTLYNGNWYVAAVPFTMARFEIPALEEYLQEHYTLILSEEFFRLFLRNDLIPAP